MAIEAGDMDEAIDALNFLQEVPCRSTATARSSSVGGRGHPQQG